MTVFKNITAFTKETPPKGYVGYVNLSLNTDESKGDFVRLSLRTHESEDGSPRFVDIPTKVWLTMAAESIVAIETRDQPKEDDPLGFDKRTANDQTGY